MPAAIPVLHFDTNDFPESQRFDTWRSAITTHQVTRSDPPSSPFDAVVDAWTLGEMVMTYSRIGAARMVRTAEMAQQDGRDWILVLLLKSGTMSFATEDGARQQTMRQGEWRCLTPFATLPPTVLRWTASPARFPGGLLHNSPPSRRCIMA